MLKRKMVSVWCCDLCNAEHRLKPIGGVCSCCGMVCELCLYYNKHGWCEHDKSTDTCADRDSDAICNINSFVKKY